MMIIKRPLLVSDLRKAVLGWLWKLLLGVGENGNAGGSTFLRIVKSCFDVISALLEVKRFLVVRPKRQLRKRWIRLSDHQIQLAPRDEKWMCTTSSSNREEIQNILLPELSLIVKFKFEEMDFWKIWEELLISQSSWIRFWCWFKEHDRISEEAWKSSCIFWRNLQMHAFQHPHGASLKT